MFFPEIDESVQALVDTSEANIGKVYKFDFENLKYHIEDGKLVEISKIDSIKQFIKWMLKTSPNKYKIYDVDFGIDYSFIGQKSLPMGLISSELKRQLKTQLEKHPMIDDITDFKAKRCDSNLDISFTVVTNDELISVNERLVI